MIKSLSAAIFVWVAAAVTAALGNPAVNYTQTNVLQNVALQLTLYQQGPTNGNGKKVSDQVTSYTTKTLLTDLGNVANQQFGNGAKLVLATVYAQETITNGSAVYSNVFSNNLTLATNSALVINGLFPLNLFNFLGNGPMVIQGDVIVGAGDVSTNVITETTGTNIQTVTINTNVNYTTTLTPSSDGMGNITNVLIVTQEQIGPPPTETVFTNVTNSINILYSPTNAFYPLTNVLNFSVDSPVIVVETGNGLDTTNPLTVTNLTTQTGFSLQSLNINYGYPTSATTSNAVTLNLEAFVRQSLKVDTLYAHGTNKVVEDIFGANSSWNVVGQGLVGPTTNEVPVVVEGTITISFLKNLPQ